MVRVVAISDVHGYLFELRTALRPIVLDRPPDLLVFTGDMIDQSLQRPRLSRFFAELRSFYNGPILAVPGNHEAQASRMALPLYWERFSAQFRSQGVRFLLDRYAEIEVGRNRPVRVAGLSWDRVYGEEVSDSEANATSVGIIQKLGIPDRTKLDLFLHHSPPRGILDKTRQNGKRSMGSGVIRHIVESLRPVVSVFGHCHESAGIERRGDTLFVNACVFSTRRGFSGVSMVPREFEFDLNLSSTNT